MEQNRYPRNQHTHIHDQLTSTKDAQAHHRGRLLSLGIVTTHRKRGLTDQCTGGLYLSVMQNLQLFELHKFSCLLSLFKNYSINYYCWVCTYMRVPKHSV